MKKMMREMGAAEGLVLVGRGGDVAASETLYDTSGDDTLSGSDDNDQFFVTAGGRDVVDGRAGDDSASFGSTFGRGDRFDGGDGIDFISLSGTYTDLSVTARMLTGVEDIDLAGGGDYDLTFSRGVGKGLSTLTVYGPSGASSRLVIDGSALAADLNVFGSSGSNLITGGAGNDLFRLRADSSAVFDGGGGFNRLSLYGLADGVTFDLRVENKQQVGTATISIRSVDDVSGTAGDDTLSGSTAANWIIANGGNDTLAGRGGDDLISAGAGLNGTVSAALSIDGGNGFDTLDIGANGVAFSGATLDLSILRFQDTGQGTMRIAGIEAVSGTAFYDTLTGDARDNALFGSDGGDTLNGGDGDDRLYGDAFYGLVSPGISDGRKAIVDNLDAAFDDVLDGGAGRDLLVGGGGIDVLIGGEGADRLFGGSGDDRFVFRSVADSLRGAADTIRDFAAGDRIDVSSVDADVSTRGDQAFHFGATPEHVGDLVVNYDATHDMTVARFFVDGDSHADMVIRFTGDVTLTAADFNL